MCQSNHVASSQGGGAGVPDDDSGYARFFELFNAGRFYDAHDALEVTWLPARATAQAHFYQGLIQVAGAFVHLQKGRPGPARRLLASAQAKLAPYPDRYGRLDLPAVRRLIEHWLALLESAGSGVAVLPMDPRPRLPVPEHAAAVRPFSATPDERG